ncbi:MAG: hypothetical protein HY909_25585 [Deltaproteobacteria bacterium]|nr:hypothetical protein [Deltaproteobacteria bacterium]
MDLSRDAQAARLSWALTALGALLARPALQAVPEDLLDPQLPLDLAVLALGAVALVAALFPSLARFTVPALACTRLSLVLLLDLAWVGAGGHLWAALSVWVALHDAERGASERQPLLPAVVALVAVCAWSGSVRDHPPARAVLVGLVAACAAMWGASRRGPTSR